MTPEQFLQRLAKSPPAPAYLFLGQETYGRKICKDALLQKVLPGELRQDGLSHFDLENIRLSEVLDDARSLSLFASDRVLWVSSAELALPRRLGVTGDEDGKDTDGTPLAAYLKQPTAGTVVVLECSRYDFSGDDRPRIERVQKFYSDIPATVEFRHYTPESSRALAAQMALQYKLKIGSAELSALLDAVAGDASRLASEMEKLSLYVGNERSVTRDDLQTMVPNAAGSTIFMLVSAMGKRDRAAALRSLDILIRDGEYLPLALTFLSTQFRLALVAREQRISSAQQAVNHFGSLGVRMWRDRAEQVVATAAAFSARSLAKAIKAIYETDKKFREGYRDDRIVMETLIFSLTAKE